MQLSYWHERDLLFPHFFREYPSQQKMRWNAMHHQTD